ncbi:rRNA methyltransferase [Clostridia bacterium]|nr:rRNA methyltransferase [Clostridia bacterium]
MDVQQILDKYERKTRFAGRTNPVVKHVTALLSNSKPNPRKLMVIEGIWAFNMALKAKLKVINFLIAPECIYSSEGEQLVEAFCDIAEDVNILSKKVFAGVSERDEPDGLMAVCELPRWELSDVQKKDALVLVLDGLEIPGNIGTIIRSADAADASAIFVVNRKARLTNPKLIKGSMGALFFKTVIEFETVSACRDWLKKNHYKNYLADTRAEKTYAEYDYAGNTALIIGSERYGIDREWYDEAANLLSIPMLGQCDSLNVAIAATVILYEARMKKGIEVKNG